MIIYTMNTGDNTLEVELFFENRLKSAGLFCILLWFLCSVVCGTTFALILNIVRDTSRILYEWFIAELYIKILVWDFLKQSDGG